VVVLAHQPSILLPKIQPQVDALILFQRSPAMYCESQTAYKPWELAVMPLPGCLVDRIKLQCEDARPGIYQQYLG
jgi:hypothetical protein